MDLRGLVQIKLINSLIYSFICCFIICVRGKRTGEQVAEKKSVCTILHKEVN